MNVSSLLRIERLNYILGGVLIAAAVVLGTTEEALGVLAGVVLSCINFSLMRKMVQRWLRTAPDRRGPQSLVVLPKMAGLMLAVFVVVFYLPVSAIGVLIGFSVFMLSITVETVRFNMSPKPMDSEQQAGVREGSDA